MEHRRSSRATELWEGISSLVILTASVLEQGNLQRPFPSLGGFKDRPQK